MNDESALRPSMRVGAEGLIVGWHGPLGPCVARFETWSRSDPNFACTLGNAGADLSATPALWPIADKLCVAFCEQEGAFVARLDAQGALLGPPELVAPNASAVAIAGGPERATLFCADDGGIVFVELDEAGASEPQRCLSERRAGAILSAARVGNEALLAFAHRGATGFGVVCARDGKHTMVRHPTRVACEDLDLRAAGTRAAVVLELGSRVHIAILGPGGKVIERPHEMARTELACPQVVWTEDSFTALARDNLRLRVVPTHENGEEFLLPRCNGAFAAGFWAQHLFALEIEANDSGAELRLWRVARDASQPQQRVVPLSLSDAAPRRARLAARHVLHGLCDRIEHAHGYRTIGVRPTMNADGSMLSVLDTEGRLSLALAPRDGALSLRVVSALGDDPRLPDPPSSLVRLARWVKTRVSSTARAAESRERAWADKLAEALDASVLRLDSAGAVLVLELRLAALPAVDRLDQWVRRVRQEQTERTGQRAQTSEEPA